MTQSVASVKVWHIVLALAAIAGIAVAWNYLTFDNIVKSDSGETFIRKSFFKPLKVAKALEVANKAVAAK